MSNPTIQTVELFHLALLSFLAKKLDKQQVVLKGGCNLRFFFGSPRYSEDMDLDIGDIPIHVTQDRVNGILQSKPFRQMLDVHGISIEHLTEHKQTETTQRWKLGLTTPGSSRPVPTKVEFSRRGLHDPPSFDSVMPALLHRYRMTPFIVAHYPGDIALMQKLEALATRRVPQARDVFDFHILQSPERLHNIRARLTRTQIASARLNALSLSFEDFKGQVLAYLSEEDQAAYDSSDIWESMQLNLVDTLGTVNEID